MLTATADTRDQLFDYFVDKVFAGRNQIVIASHYYDSEKHIEFEALEGAFSAGTERGNCQPTLESESSTVPPQVEMGGIEPPSDGRTTGLLRVQLASVFLGPGVSREQGRRRAQSMKSPKSPTDTGSQQWLPR